MIFSTEVNAILDGTMPACQIANAMELAQGGIHHNVLPAERKAFLAKIMAVQTRPDPVVISGQMDLLEGDA